MCGHDFASVKSRVSTLLTSVDTTITEIVEKDNKDAISGKDRIEDNNSCAADELERFEEDAENLLTRLNEAKPKLRKIWTDSFVKHCGVPASLNLIDSKWVTLDGLLGDIHQRVLAMSKQTHWEGSGADAYLKELPYQAAAVSELLAVTRTEREYLDRSAQIHQAVFTGIRSHIQQVRNQLQGIRDSFPPDGVYFQRVASAIGVMESGQQWMANLRDGDYWRDAVAQLKQYMTKAGSSLSVFTAANKWPSATKATSGSKPPKAVDLPKSQLPAGQNAYSVPQSYQATTPTGGGLDINNNERYD